MSSFEKSLLQQCTEKIKRWPRLNAQKFPTLPQYCNFVICGRGGYKLDIHGRHFTNEQINKEKKRIIQQQGEIR